MATVKMTKEAAVEFAGLSKTIRERVRKLVERLDKWPEVSGAKRLSGDLAGWYRVRTGDYRVRFYVGKDVVVIDKIGHRSDFYED
jgi:mRNA interferase RelE/StbE